MKTPNIVILLGFLCSPVLAQDTSQTAVAPTAPQQRPKAEWREFSTADVRDVLFNATTGFMLFTIDGVTYRHAPRFTSTMVNGANVSAIAATLAELRQAKRFKVSVEPTKEEGKSVSIVDLVILYDTLK